MAGCHPCQAYQASVQRLDALAAHPGAQGLQRDLRPATRAHRPPQRPLTARQWAPVIGLTAMLVGALLSMRFGSRNAVPAAGLANEILTGLSKYSAAYHERYWQADGDHQEGDLKLIAETWYDSGKWRITSALGEGGDRIFRPGTKPAPIAGSLVRVHRRKDGKLQYSYELGDTPDNHLLANVFRQEGLMSAAAKAKYLGRKKLDGQSGEEFLFQPNEHQRTYLWVVPDKRLPMQIERQNDQGHGWRTSWIFKFDYATHWPAREFDPSTLGTDEPALYQVPVSPKPASPDDLKRDGPTWMTADVFFEGYLWNRPKNSRAACLNDEVAKSLEASMSRLFHAYGNLKAIDPLRSEPGDHKDEASQEYSLRFEHGQASADLSFVRDSSGIWRIDGIHVTLK